MQRGEYVVRILSRLGEIRFQLESFNGAELYNYNKISEDLFKDLLNLIYHLNLENLNAIVVNFPAIDLGDEKARICYQITSDCSRAKVKETIKKFIEQKLYEKYDRLIVFSLKNKIKQAED